MSYSLKPNHEARLRAISLGAGVQSSTLLMMADKGEIGPRPDLAIFADTGWEPPEVYRNLSWLQKNCSIPIHGPTCWSVVSFSRTSGGDSPTKASESLPNHNRTRKESRS